MALIVGKAAVMRVSSVILPSSSGTLKSTRTRTRLPFKSTSRMVFLFNGWLLTNIHGARKGRRFRRRPEIRRSALDRFTHKVHNVAAAAGIAPLVVVPGHDLDHRLVDYHREFGIPNARMPIA